LSERRKVNDNLISFTTIIDLESDYKSVVSIGNNGNIELWRNDKIGEPIQIEIGHSINYISLFE
jgi:hypothetical protein